MHSRTTLHITAHHPERKVLVTGASGYVGGRVIPELLEAGFGVRAMSRNASSLERFDWSENVDIVEGDLDNLDSLRMALKDVDVAFYLVHSMGGKDEDFEEAESRAARNFAQAAEEEHVSQIVYLSGLHPKNKSLEQLSKHMRSRERVAHILLDSEVSTVVLQAATLIGSGSASFEIIRHLAERLPVMVAPQWITNKIEPLAIRDALYYLVSVADLDDPNNGAYDVGCGKTYEFADLIRLYARARNMHRFITSVPIPLPMDTLSGMWIGLVTPVPAQLAFPLAQSMAEDAVTDPEYSIKPLIPDPPEGLIDYPTAVDLALEREEIGAVATSWDDSWKYSLDPADSLPTDPEWAGLQVYTDVREGESDLAPEQVWKVIEGIGGSHGWYSAPVLWQVRGLMDKIVGGPGLGGRRDPQHLEEGDRVDWWRVEDIKRGEHLVLRAEMKLNGKAWLKLEVQPRDGGGSLYKQSAIYCPQGTLGHMYWWAVYPFHGFIFPLMRKNILRAAADGR